MFKRIFENWERTILNLVAMVFLGFSFWFLWNENVTASAASFGMAFLSMMFASIARFKRFKGLGFEAELWEDKQREAASLIERLKGIVEIYTRETIMSRVMSGRWGGQRGGWKANWKLFDELNSQHSSLGQNINLSELKDELDRVFIFDMVQKVSRGILDPIQRAFGQAQQDIRNEFGSPIQDAIGFSEKNSLLKNIPNKINDPYQVSQERDLAQDYLQLAERAQREYKSTFNIEIEYDEACVMRLKEISKLYEKRPIDVTEKLLTFVDDS